MNLAVIVALLGFTLFPAMAPAHSHAITVPAQFDRQSPGYTVASLSARLAKMPNLQTFVLEHINNELWNANTLSVETIGSQQVAVIGFDQDYSSWSRSDWIGALSYLDPYLPVYVTTPNDTEPLAYVVVMHRLTYQGVWVFITFGHE